MLYKFVFFIVFVVLLDGVGKVLFSSLYILVELVVVYIVVDELYFKLGGVLGLVNIIFLC